MKTKQMFMEIIPSLGFVLLLVGVLIMTLGIRCAIPPYMFTGGFLTPVGFFTFVLGNMYMKH